LFPDAEIEGVTKKPDPKKKNGAEKFVDYHLQVAERLMKEKIEAGRDWLTPDPIDEANSKSLVEAAPAGDKAATEKKQ
jgi:hypothetical protein